MKQNAHGELHDKTTYMRRNRPPAASLPTLELAVEQKEEEKKTSFTLSNNNTLF
jgi:hypothetical protein